MTWELIAGRNGRDWSLTLTSPTESWIGKGSDCFGAVRDLMAQLEALEITIGVDGARPNAWSSGMQRDMGEGRTTYLTELGSHGRPATVQTLDPAPLDSVGTLIEQDNFHGEWLAERGN